MQFYSKEALQQVYDQVNRDNPNLPLTLTPAIAALTKGPISKTENGRNTQVDFTGYPGSGVQGKVTLYYDRINLTQLFSFRPKVYLPLSVTTLRAAIPYLIDGLGIMLVPEDFPQPDLALRVTPFDTSVNFTIAPTSPAYTGQLQIIYTSEDQGLFMDSGPGPKYLRAGDQMAGFFGKVEERELFSKSELIQQLFQGLASPTLVDGAAGYYKFFYQGSVIYIPISSVGYNISWNALYNAGVVYGEEGVGRYPTNTPVSQSKILIKDTTEGRFYLRPRLPTISVQDPVDISAPFNIAGSELELMNRCYDTGIWGPSNEVTWSRVFLARNTRLGSLGYCWAAYMSAASIISTDKAGSSTSLHWWPVLELVDTSQVTLGLEEFHGKVENTLQPVPFTSNNELLLTPVVLGLPRTVDFQPITFETIQTEQLHPIEFGLPKTIDFRPIVVTVELSDEPTKTDLSSLNGELTGFN